MKHISQILIIFAVTALAELLHACISLPIPASIYGMVLLFAALSLKLIRLSQVQPLGSVLAGLLPLLFVAPVVGLMDIWDTVRENILPIAVILVFSSIVCFAAAGWITQALTRRGGDGCD